MVIIKNSKRTYIALRVTVACAVFYFAMMGKSVEASVSTDCSAPLDVEGETYILSGTTSNPCVIYANNITIDGSGLYSITGANVYSSAMNPGDDGYDFTLKDIVLLGGNVRSDGNAGTAPGQNGGDGGDITIINTVVNSAVYSKGGNSNTATGGNGGTVILTNSSANLISTIGQKSGNGGNITVQTGSTVINGITASGGSNFSDTGGNGGSINVVDSDVQDVTSNGGTSGGYGYGANGGNIVITSSTARNISNVGTYSYYNDGGVGGSVTIENSEVNNVTANGGGSYYGSGGAGGDVVVTDSEVVAVSNTGSPAGDLTITDTAPTLTLIGDNPMTIAYTDTYVEPGATASDTKYTVSDLSGDVVVTGTVDAAAGDYTLTYTVEDLGTTITWNGTPTTEGPNTTTTTRVVTRSADTTPPTPAPHSRITGGSAAGYRSGNTFVMSPTSTSPTTKFIFTKNLKYLMLDNEVKELQKFLNTHGYPVSLTGAGSNGLETTKFGSLTQKALIKFQKANNITPAVGYFGPITRAKVNSLLN
jgi:hypothetical protein